MFVLVPITFCGNVRITGWLEHSLGPQLPQAVTSANKHAWGSYPMGAFFRKHSYYTD